MQLSPAWKAADLKKCEIRNAASEVAQRFEEDILSNTNKGMWIFGPTVRLANNYKISTPVARQALRILEARNIGRMRRGHGGGLLVKPYSLDSMTKNMAIYLSALNIKLNDIKASRNDLERHLCMCSTTTKDFITEIFNSLENQFLVPSSSGNTSEYAPNRAFNVAQMVIAKANNNHGKLLGSIDEMCETFSSGKKVILQAIRILEDMELIVSSRGRGGGLRLTKPSLSTIARLSRPHLMARDFSCNVSFDIIWAINRVSTERIINLPDYDMKEIKKICDEIITKNFMQGEWIDQILLFRTIADHTNNPVLHMLAKCFFLYELENKSFSHVVTTESYASMAAKATHDVGIAILEKNSEAALSAVDNCIRIYNSAISELYKTNNIYRN